MNITEPRYSILDSMGICAVAILIAQSQFLLAAVVGSVGVAITAIIGEIFGKRAKDRQWQQLARQDCTVEAIKKHRELYGTSLKEALDIVYAYQGKPPRQ